MGKLIRAVLRGGDGGNAISLTRSWKRRLRYGTLLCDLESGKPIDVLADREVETVSAWFEQHPGVEIVSRDRSSEYAAAIRKGAPQALQVADLWHIGKNLADSVSALLARCRAEIRRGLPGQTMPEHEQEETEPMLEEERQPPRGRLVKLAQEGRRAQKLDRYTWRTDKFNLVVASRSGRQFIAPHRHQDTVEVLA